MLGQIVVDDQRVLAIVAEILTDCGTGEWCEELHGSRITGAGRHHHAVFHGMILFERLDDPGDRRTLLTDGDVDTKDAQTFLIDDRIDGDGGLAGLAITDDQFALTAADRNHRINGLNARLQRFTNGLPGIHTGRHDFNAGRMRRLDRPFPVDGLTDRIDHTTDQRFTDRNFCDTAGALDRIPFLDSHIVAHQHGADVVLFQIQGDAIESAWKLEHFTGHGPVKAVDLGDTVSDLNDGTRLLDIDLLVEALNLFLDDRTDFFRPDLHDDSFILASTRPANRASGLGRCCRPPCCRSGSASRPGGWHPSET